MTLIFFFWGGGEEVRWKTVRTYGKILATPLSSQFFLRFCWRQEVDASCSYLSALLNLKKVFLISLTVVSLL